MGQADELVIEDVVFAQAADGNAHTVADIPVQFGLGTIGFFEVGNEGGGGAGQFQLLGHGGVILPDVQDFFFGGGIFKGYAHSRQMAVGNGHADALGADHGSGGMHDFGAFCVQFAPDLQGFLFALFFFAADVGDHVIQNFGPAVKGFAGAGDGLEGGNVHFLDAKGAQGRQGRHIALDGAVGLYGNEALFGTQALALSMDDGGMGSVDFGNQHGHVGQQAAGAVVADHGGFGAGVGFFQRAGGGLIHIHGAENKIAQGRDFFHFGSIVNGHCSHFFGDGPGESPTAFHSLLIGLTGTAAAGSQHGNFKPGMFIEQSDQTLTHHAGGADNTNAILLFQFFHNTYPPIQCTLSSVIW